MNKTCQRSSLVKIIGILFVLAAILVIAPLIIRRVTTGDDAIFTRGPYLQNARQDRVTLCWETDKPSTATVEILDGNGTVVRSLTTPSTALRHEMVIDGLDAGRQYGYEIRSAAKSSGELGGTFRTATTPGEPIEFAVWGDSRKNRDTCQRMAKLILETGVPLALHSGDFVSEGVNLFEWNWMFFEPCRDLLRSVVIWPAIGNHELGSTPEGLDGRRVYTDVFALPGDEIYYSFDYGDAHFLVLDSNLDFCEDEGQYRFAISDLEATKARWRLVMWHHPVFNSGNHPSQIAMRTRYCPLLAGHNVDMIITGHDHNYQLTKPIRHHYEPGQKRPYYQLVSGGGGADLYDVRSNEIWSYKGTKANHFVLFRIDGDRLNAQVIDIDGKVLDTFEIDKSKNPTDEVFYELIELERIYKEPMVVDAQGNPLELLLLEPEQTEETIGYKLMNPLPEPIKVQMTITSSEGLEFLDAVKEIVIPGQKSAIMNHPFRMIAPEKIHPLAGLQVAFDSPVGSRQLHLPAPPIALRRTITAPATNDPIVIDGKAAEAGWDKAPTYEKFVKYADGSLHYQDAECPSTLRVLHDDQKLYALITSIQPSGMQPQFGRSIESSDHISLYLANQAMEISYWIDTLGRARHEGTAEMKIEAAFGMENGNLTWELAIPLKGLINTGPGAGGQCVFNVFERRGNDYYSLAPTFGRKPNRMNGAGLTLGSYSETSSRFAHIFSNHKTLRLRTTKRRSALE